MLSDFDVLQRFHFQRPAAEMLAASQKTIAITAILTFVYLSVVAERRVVAAVGAARTLEPT